jgi:hypothetical protein
VNSNTADSTARVRQTPGPVAKKRGLLGTPPCLLLFRLTSSATPVFGALWKHPQPASTALICKLGLASHVQAAAHSWVWQKADRALLVHKHPTGWLLQDRRKERKDIACFELCQRRQRRINPTSPCQPGTKQAACWDSTELPTAQSLALVKTPCPTAQRCCQLSIAAINFQKSLKPRGPPCPPVNKPLPLSGNTTTRGQPCWVLLRCAVSRILHCRAQTSCAVLCCVQTPALQGTAAYTCTLHPALLCCGQTPALQGAAADTCTLHTALPLHPTYNLALHPTCGPAPASAAD